MAELKATPEPPKGFDRLAFLKRFAGAREIEMLVSSPQQLRQALRKFSIDRILVYPDGRGWSFESKADLGGLLTTGAPEERAG